VPYAPLWSINLSGQTIGDPTFIDFVIEHLKRNDLAGNRVCFEITETVAIKSLEGAKAYILRLKELGCRFSLDDFGAGLSSFTYLKALPVDYVKIDGSFVKGIVNDPVSQSMVKAITQVGQAMGLKVIAEYVENAEVMWRLRELGVDYAQGYGVQKPLPLDAHVSSLAPLRMALIS
jgi:EAL domain-containing protein (putative c-di-GMP-specific phosphodiesterase class I)